MELSNISSDILDDTNSTTDNNVIAVLKKTLSNESIIYEMETEDTEEAEVEEIIEIIEEVEEDDTSQECDINYARNTDISSNDDEIFQEISNNNEFQNSTESHIVSERNTTTDSTCKVSNVSKTTNGESNKSNIKQVVTYDIEEDWQDEEVEHVDETVSKSNFQMKHNHNKEKKSVNGQMISYTVQSSKNESYNDAGKIEKSPIEDYQTDSNSVTLVECNNQHEIIQNAENNLVYTVLESKKSHSTSQVQKDKFTDAQYVKMEQLNEDTIPVEGIIYYEGNDMETLYIAQPVNESEQYQYDSSTMEQDEQTWEDSNFETEQEQQNEENSQDQIFLHEDEEGQLYFKDENGTLQPVYLTEDGNYAIAENSDDQDSKESQGCGGESPRLSEQDSYIMPDMEVSNSPTNNKQNIQTLAHNEIDNEDNTVTISLIISEDEHGQKRTQVIIPTTDNLKCDICNKSFKTSFQLLRHNRLKHAREEDITTRNFPCDLCPKRYPDQNSLARHRKTHTGDRPFQCLECHKNFPTSTALRRHLTLHNSQSRPLPCIYCGRRFMDKATLTKHEQSHLAGDQRLHTCDICHKSFSNATDLSMHKKHHDPDKKFDCEVCGREFNRLNNLQRHMMVHQQQQGGNEEILSCNVCGITYKFMSSLTRHMVTTHMNPEKLRQQAEEQRRKRENNYRRYLENRKMYETQHSGSYSSKRNYHQSSRLLSENSEDNA